METQIINAVIEQLGYLPDDIGSDDNLMCTLSDISTHGADNGFTGFIYYVDTVNFAHENRQAILSMARDMADDLGIDCAYSLIAGFNCLDDVTADDVADALHDENHGEHTSVMNALSWFALEEVAHHYDT